METNYLAIPQKQEGYLDFLRQFRVEVPLATSEHYPLLEFRVKGELPQQVRDALPIFGLSKADIERSVNVKYHALNSGGRGILLSDGETHLRFKGNDLDGAITECVAESKKNQISDISLAAQYVVRHGCFSRNRWKDGIYDVPSYSQGDRPFSFFTKASVQREKQASGILGKEFEKKGFFRPYSLQAVITYPKIRWQGESCSTMVFRLPTLESDLRYAEFQRHAFWHLKFASPEELAEVAVPLNDFMQKLMSWYGFNIGIMERKGLSPQEDSHQHQNYVLCHVTSSEIGAARVDHTSTVINKKRAAELCGGWKKEMFFSTLGLDLLHALALANQGFEADFDYYTGYFDVAYKWKWGNIDLSNIGGALDYVNDVNAAFSQGFNGDPMPISQNDFISVVEMISKIRIDGEKQERIRQTQEETLRKAGIDPRKLR
jgi:hypothetical protein